ncbi:MAG TPA: hypothetical protein VGJ40_03025 [Gaiellaceae bacterium]|jgi:hypothetical protein
MRKLVVLLLFALAVPVAAYSQPTAANGTLSIREGRGTVQLNARGSITGRLIGRISITDPKPYDSKRPIVYGATKTSYRNVRTTIYQGKNLRFRLIGARFELRMDGRAIFLSAIARGDGVIDGAGDPAANIFYDGVWSLNDEPYRSLPDTAESFDLAATPGAP